MAQGREWGGKARVCEGRTRVPLLEGHGFRTTQAYHRNTTGGSCCGSSAERNSLRFSSVNTDTNN